MSDKHTTYQDHLDEMVAKGCSAEYPGRQEICELGGEKWHIH